MNDVAKRADVSLKTVSRYVNGETNIGPDLAERIRQAIQELGYQRNLAAAGLRPGWSNRMVGLVISDLANPYYSTLAGAAEAELAAEGYILIVTSSGDQDSKYQSLVTRLAEQRVDGFLIVLPRGACSVGPLNAPAVFLDRPPIDMDADCVLSDNRGGARQAVEMLVNAGSRRIPFLGDSLDIFTMSERYKGYEEALAAAGIDPWSIPQPNFVHTREEALQATKALLKTDIDSIFAANNRASVGAVGAMAETGRILPLVGFDEIEAANVIAGGLTLVEQDAEQMGRTAAQLLLARLKGEDFPARRVVLPTRIASRGSESVAL